MGKCCDPPPLDVPIGAGRERPTVVTGTWLCRSGLYGFDRFGLEAGLLLPVVRDAPEAGLRHRAAMGHTPIRRTLSGTISMESLLG